MNASSDFMMGNGSYQEQGLEERQSIAGHIILASVSGITMIAGAFGNFMVLAAIFREDRLHSKANYLIGSLAVTDLMVSLLVVPYAATMVIFDGVWWISHPISCGVFVFLDVTCCTVSILHLCVIAWIRFKIVLKIRLPQYSRSFKSVLRAVVGIWSSAVILSVAPFLMFRSGYANASASHVGSTVGYNSSIELTTAQPDNKCVVNDNKVYRVVATTAAFYAPLAFILVIYTKMARFAWAKIRRNDWRKRPEERTKQFATVTQKLRRFFRPHKTSEKPGQTTEKTLAPRPDESSDTTSPKAKRNGTGDGFYEKYLENNNPHHRQNIVIAAATTVPSDRTKCSDPYLSGQSPFMAPRRTSRHILNAHSELRAEPEDPNLLGMKVSDRVRVQVLCNERSPSMRKFKSSIDLSRTNRFQQDSNIAQLMSLQLTPLSDRNPGDSKSLSTATCATTSSATTPLVYSRVQADDFQRQTCAIQVRNPGETRVEIARRPARRTLVIARKSRLMSSAPFDMTYVVHRRLVTMKLRRERKIIFTLGMVIGAFVACWLPFFVKELIIPFCESCHLSQEAEIFINWLGYFNSALNPIIYAFTNREFNTAFRKMCCSRRKYRLKTFQKQDVNFHPYIQRKKPSTI